MADRYLDPEWEEAELPEAPELAALAAYGERTATPLAPSVVRRLGARRRRRRHAAVAAGTLALAVLVGGVAVGTNRALFTTEPPVVASPLPTTAPTTAPSSPSPSPSVPAGGLTTANLLQTEDIPVQRSAQRVEVAAGDSWPARASVCVPDGGPMTLGATQALTRNFGYRYDDPGTTPDPSDPSTGQPTYYTQVLQFADVDAAAAATDTYAGWLDRCPKTMAAKGLTLIGGGGATTWTDVNVDRTATQTGTTVGRFATLPLFREPGDASEAGWFGSVGLTQSDDRLMVTVRMHYGNDDQVSLQQGGGNDPATEHPQFALVLAATRRLVQ